MKTVETVILILFALSIAAGVFLIIGHFIYYEIWCNIPRSCKNAAFREYKTRTIKNLEDEEQEFINWLDEVAIAADRSAFKQFKASKK